MSCFFTCLFSPLRSALPPHADRERSPFHAETGENVALRLFRADLPHRSGSASALAQHVHAQEGMSQGSPLLHLAPFLVTR